MATRWVKWALEAAPTHDRNELLLLVVLAEAANPEGYCWPSKKTLARAMRMDERSIPRIVQRLQAKSLIRVTPRQRTNGSQSSNGYQLLADHHYANTTENDIDVTPSMTLESSQARTLESSLEPSVEPKKEPKDSPAEKSPSKASAVLSPYGDAHAGVASRRENEQEHREPEKTFSVKANDSSQILNLHDQEKSLPVSSAEQAPAPRAVRPANQLSHAVQPVIDAPRPAPKSASQSTAHSHKSGATKPASAPAGSYSQPASPLIKPNAMQAVITYAFKIGQGSYAGKMGQFLAAKLPPRHKDMWSQHQPDKPASPQEIMALLSWYRQHAAYASSCAERGGKLPSTPAILRDRLDEFRDSEGYALAMQAAQPLLDRLLRGESIIVPVTPASAKPSNAIGAVESVGAYNNYDPKRDPAYRREVDSDAAAVAFERLFGGS